MAAQPFDGSMTASFEDIMTETRTGGRTSRRPTRRQKAPPMDPRRAPGAIAGSPQTVEGTAAPPGAQPAAAVVGPKGIASGILVIREALSTMPAQPGVYRMLGRRGDGLYVGKARNLKSRVQNYAHPAGLSNRLRRMVAETAAVELVVT